MDVCVGTETATWSCFKSSLILIFSYLIFSIDTHSEKSTTWLTSLLIADNIDNESMTEFKSISELSILFDYAANIY